MRGRIAPRYRRDARQEERAVVTMIRRTMSSIGALAAFLIAAGAAPTSASAPAPVAKLPKR
jgi:hypothetical protein